MAVSTAYVFGRTYHDVRRSVPRWVYAKRKWSDPWVHLPYCDCVSMEEDAAPSMSSARLRYHYGWIKREGRSQPRLYYPLDISGAYIAIKLGGTAGLLDRFPPVWVGVCDYERHLPHGTVGYFQGPQDFQCYGLGHLLDRVQITGAHTEDGYIDRAVVFNRPEVRGQAQRGNRSANPGAAGVYVVSRDGKEWTNLDLVQYLLQYYAPEGLTFVLVGHYTALDNFVEQWDFDGKSLWQCLNELIDRRRGLGFNLVSTGSGPIYVNVWSTLTAPIAVGDTFLPANPDQVIVGFDGLRDVQPAITLNRLATYDAVEVRGGPVYTTFSLSAADETLEPAWTPEQETAYKAGSGDAEADTQDHDAERGTDKHGTVYRVYRVPDNWDWQVGDGEGGETTYNAAPTVKDDGTIDYTTAAPAWQGGKQFERELCLLEDPESDSNPEYRKAFVVVRHPDDDTWHFVERLDAVGLTPASVRPGDSGLTIEVSPQGAAHVAALNHFDTADDGTSDTNTDPQYDYETYIATVQVATDQHLRIRVELPGVWHTETGRTKVIDYPSAVAWIVVPGTVLDVTDGELVRADDWQVERDDTDTLRTIAALAAAWYLQPRSELSWELQGVSVSHPVGQLVRGLASQWTLTDVASVITRRAWDFSGPIPTTTWQTGFSELSAQAIPKGEQAVTGRRPRTGAAHASRARK